MKSFTIKIRALQKIRICICQYKHSLKENDEYFFNILGSKAAFYVVKSGQ